MVHIPTGKPSAAAWTLTSVPTAVDLVAGVTEEHLRPRVSTVALMRDPGVPGGPGTRERRRGSSAQENAAARSAQGQTHVLAPCPQDQETLHRIPGAAPPAVEGVGSLPQGLFANGQGGVSGSGNLGGGWPGSACCRTGGKSSQPLMNRDGNQ